jgi:hypothetical protein
VAADLHLELQKRNARLRAWKVLGVPVSGGWEVEHLVAVDPRTMRAVADSTPVVTLRLRCGRCDRSTHFPHPPDDLSLLSLRRAEAARLESLEWLGCTHLAPLLQPDPPELAALLDLEILAGA